MDRYGASNMIQAPNLRQAIRDAVQNDTALLGSVLGIGSVANAKCIAATSSDFTWIDIEHSAYSPTLLVELIQTLKFYSHGKIIPVVRVPNHSHEWISWTLDAGAGGVIIPHTETVEQVKASIAAVRFPPHGHRSFPPFAVIPGLQDTAPEGKTWLDVASEHCAVIPQIESRKGVENLEAIMQTPGIDAIMIGFIDLTLDIGKENTKELVATTEYIHTLAKKYSMPLATVAFEHQIAERFQQGYRIIATAVDVWILTHGIERELKNGRKVLEKVRIELTRKEAPQASLQGIENGRVNANGHTGAVQ